MVKSHIDPQRAMELADIMVSAIEQLRPEGTTVGEVCIASCISLMYALRRSGELKDKKAIEQLMHNYVREANKYFGVCKEEEYDIAFRDYSKGKVQ